MPKGHYETAERVLWAAARIEEAAGAFQARMGRLPFSNEWQAAYGLPDRSTVKRVCGSLPEVLGMSESTGGRQSDRAYHFASGKRRRRG